MCLGLSIVCHIPENHRAPSPIIPHHRLSLLSPPPANNTYIHQQNEPVVPGVVVSAQKTSLFCQLGPAQVTLSSPATADVRYDLSFKNTCGHKRLFQSLTDIGAAITAITAITAIRDYSPIRNSFDPKFDPRFDPKFDLWFDPRFDPKFDEHSAYKHKHSTCQGNE